MNEQRKQWEKFKKTGKIEDYLNYKKSKKRKFLSKGCII